MTRGRHILSTPAIAQGERLCRGRRTSRAYGSLGLLSVVLIFGLLLSAGDLYAGHVIRTPYVMGFEEADSVELAHWVFTPGYKTSSRMEERWVTGSTYKSAGKRALYISKDGGKTGISGKGYNSAQYAYMDFELPLGTYEVTFDWCCTGLEPTWGISTGLYVGAGRASQVDLTGKAASIICQDWCDKTAGAMLHSIRWTSTTIQVKIESAAPYRLFFMWYSGSDWDNNYQLSACVDNVQITSCGCERPTGIAIHQQSDSVAVTWHGNSNLYQLAYCGADGVWSKPYVTTDTAYILGDLEEGVYDFRVRGVCGADTGAYAYLGQYAVSYPDGFCMDYTDLYAPYVTCRYGTVNNPYSSVGVIEEGKDIHSGRHVVNTQRDQLDPVLQHRLQTIPDGELRSVRLGNMIPGGDEDVAYTYVADLRNRPILIFKYAVVGEYAHPDYKDSEPKFAIEIRNTRLRHKVVFPTREEDNIWFAGTDTMMGERYYYAHDYGYGWDYEHIVWRDWTTLGVNLASLEVKDGDTLLVRLYNTDCPFGGHFGYAYFTLGCSAGEVAGNGCGEQPVNVFEAPDGFYYRWYAASNPDKTLSRERVFRIRNYDEPEFRVDMAHKYDTTQVFTLPAYTASRTPIAKAVVETYQKDCSNYARFTDTSFVTTRNYYTGEVVEHSSIPVDAVSWDFGVLGQTRHTDSQSEFEMELPASGGTFPISLTAYAGRCESTATADVTVPALGADTTFDIQTVTGGQFYLYVGDRLVTLDHDTALVLSEGQNIYGCDSVHILRVQYSTPVMDIAADRQSGNTGYIVARGERISVAGETVETYRWCTLTGQCIAEGPLPHLAEGIPVPTIQGWYILTIRTGGGEIVKRVVVK